MHPEATQTKHSSQGPSALNECQLLEILATNVNCFLTLVLRMNPDAYTMSNK